MVSEFPAGDFGGVVAVVGIDGKLDPRNGAWRLPEEADLAGRLKITEIGWSCR